MSTHTIFTYGTLCFPQVMSMVTGTTFPTRMAYLQDYSCFLVKNQVFPAIIPQSGGMTKGILHYDIDDSALQRLDEFEAIIYSRHSLIIHTEETLTEVSAGVYVLDDDKRHYLTNTPWDADYFQEHHLEEYIQR